MSGGHFDYNQYKIGYIADEVEELIIKNKEETLDRYGDKMFANYDDEVIKKFIEGYKALRQAQIYTQRIDWLVSGDDGEESFLSRLEDDLLKFDVELAEFLINLKQ